MMLHLVLFKFLTKSDTFIKLSFYNIFQFETCNLYIDKNKYNIHLDKQIILMNILSHEQMLEKQEMFLQLYKNQKDVKIKFDLSELIQLKQRDRSAYVFSKCDKKSKFWVKKLVPLTKNIKMISVNQEQNALFKVITYVLLFIIYKDNKKQSHSSQYIKDQLKCSLYSEDVDLLQIKNHSFNKKMKNDIIKSGIAAFFIQISQILANNYQNNILSDNKITEQDIIQFCLQKNDSIAEGFHLFFRNILSKLQVQNANNCINQVNPQQAISNLIQFFQIDCRVFHNLYLFNEVGVFIAEINKEVLVFGKYYENQMEFQQTSEQQKIQQNIVTDINLNSFLKVVELKQEDAREFNFILDSDRNSYDSQYKILQKNSQAQTPSFLNMNQQLKFGKKKSIGNQTEKELDNSFNKIKDRLQSQRINQIQSEQQDFQAKNNQDSPHFKSQTTNFEVQNTNKEKFLNFKVSNEYDFQQDDSAPTPILGGGTFFNFGLKQRVQINNNSYHSKHIKGYDHQGSSSHKKISGQNSSQKLNMGQRQAVTQNKEVKVPPNRRQSYQGDKSSKSKSSENKKLQMKTSKNQIKLIDQTASRISLTNLGVQNKKLTQQDEGYIKERKQTMGFYDKHSSYTNCTCHLQKKNRIKIQSQIVEMKVETKLPSSSRKISEDFLLDKKQSSPLKSNNPFSSLQNNFNLGNRIQIVKEQNIQNQRIRYNKQQKQEKFLRNQNLGESDKRKDFISFLKKDKTELIKKLSQKRHYVKTNVTMNGLMQNGKSNNTENQRQRKQDVNKDSKRTFIKQSMFVGSFNTHNPQSNFQYRNEHNKAVNPSYSLEKRERSLTPTSWKIRKNENENVNTKKINFTNEKINSTSHKNSFQMTYSNNINPQQNNIPLKDTFQKIPLFQNNLTPTHSTSYETNNFHNYTQINNQNQHRNNNLNHVHNSNQHQPIKFINSPISNIVIGNNAKNFDNQNYSHPIIVNSSNYTNKSCFPPGSFNYNQIKSQPYEISYKK